MSSPFRQSLLAAPEIIDHGSPTSNDVVTGSAVLPDSPAYWSGQCWDCQTDFSSPAVPFGMPSHRSISTASAGFVKSNAKSNQTSPDICHCVQLPGFFLDRADRVNPTSSTAAFQSHPRFQPTGSFRVSESSTLPDSPRRSEYGDRPHGRSKKSLITRSTSLPSLGMWACIANPKYSGADPNLSQTKRDTSSLSHITEGYEATSSSDQPSILSAVPVCFLASFSNSAPDTAGHVWTSREGKRVCNRVSRRSDISRLGCFQTFRQWKARVARTSAISWVASSSALLAIEPWEDVGQVHVTKMRSRRLISRYLGRSRSTFLVLSSFPRSFSAASRFTLGWCSLTPKQRVL